MKYSDPSSASTPSMPAGGGCCLRLCGGEGGGRQLALRTRTRVSTQKTIDSWVTPKLLLQCGGASKSAGGFDPTEAEDRPSALCREFTADSPPGTTKACALDATSASAAAAFCIPGGESKVEVDGCLDVPTNLGTQFYQHHEQFARNGDPRSPHWNRCSLSLINSACMWSSSGFSS